MVQSPSVRLRSTPRSSWRSSSNRRALSVVIRAGRSVPGRRRSASSRARSAPGRRGDRHTDVLPGELVVRVTEVQPRERAFSCKKRLTCKMQGVRKSPTSVKVEAADAQVPLDVLRRQRYDRPTGAVPARWRAASSGTRRACGRPWRPCSMGRARVNHIGGSGIPRMHGGPRARTVLIWAATRMHGRSRHRAW